MEEKMVKKATAEENKADVETALFALGVVLLMAGLKHASASLLQQWHAFVFLLLNVVVLTILATSVRFGSKKPEESNEAQKIQIDTETPEESNESRKIQIDTETPEESNEARKIQIDTDHETRYHYKGRDAMLTRRVNPAGEEEEEEEEDWMSKEELNARAEAFIVMFRQQLASDRTKLRSRCSFGRSNEKAFKSPEFN